MLAARMYGINDLRIEEMPKPKIGAGEILVKVRAAAICGTDVRMLTSGAKGTDSSQPLVLGHEFAGDIVEIGSEVTGYQAGMRVAVAPNMAAVCVIYASAATDIYVRTTKPSASIWTALSQNTSEFPPAR